MNPSIYKEDKNSERTSHHQETHNGGLLLSSILKGEKGIVFPSCSSLTIGHSHLTVMLGRDRIFFSDDASTMQQTVLVYLVKIFL